MVLTHQSRVRDLKPRIADKALAIYIKMLLRALVIKLVSLSAVLKVCAERAHSLMDPLTAQRPETTRYTWAVDARVNRRAFASHTWGASFSVYDLMPSEVERRVYAQAALDTIRSRNDWEDAVRSQLRSGATAPASDGHLMKLPRFAEDSFWGIYIGKDGRLYLVVRAVLSDQQGKARMRLKLAAATGETWATMLADPLFIEIQRAHKVANDLLAQFVLNILEIRSSIDVLVTGSTYNFPTDDVGINSKSRKVIRRSFVTLRNDPPDGAHLQFSDTSLRTADLITPQHRLVALENDRPFVSDEFKFRHHYVPMITRCKRPLVDLEQPLVAEGGESTCPYNLTGVYISSWTWGSSSRADVRAGAGSASSKSDWS